MRPLYYKQCRLYYSVGVKYFTTLTTIFPIGWKTCFPKPMQIGRITGTKPMQAPHPAHAAGSTHLYVPQTASMRHPIMHRFGLALPLHSCKHVFQN